MTCPIYTHTRHCIGLKRVYIQCLNVAEYVLCALAHVRHFKRLYTPYKKHHSNTFIPDVNFTIDTVHTFVLSLDYEYVTRGLTFLDCVV